MSTTDGLDDFLTKVGTGKWNYLFIATSFTYSGALPVFLIGNEFLNAVTSYSCDIPNNNRTRPMNGSQCEMIEEDSNGYEKIMPCEKWIYDTSVFHSTVTMDWNLVCERAWLSPLFQTIYSVGCFLGVILAAITSDRYGRRWSIRAGSVFTAGFTIVLLISPWLWLIMLARFLLGIFNAILNGNAFMISMEVCSPSMRPIVGILYSLPYALMVIGLSGLAYWIREWRLLQAATSWPCLLLLVLVCFIDESPRWLIVKGHLEEAVQVLQRAVRLNQPKFPQDLDVSALVYSIRQRQNEKTTQITQKDSAPSLHLPSGNTLDSFSSTGTKKMSLIKSDNYLDLDDGIGPWWAGPVALVRTKIMAKVTLGLSGMVLLQGVVYLGLPLSSRSFKSPFLYIALLGALEIPLCILAGPVTRRFGRKPILSTCLTSCGILLILTAALLLADIKDERVIMTLILTGFLFVATAYAVNILYAPELFPTTLRPWGTAAFVLSNYAGFSISPIIVDYAEDLVWVPPVVMGACSIVSGSLLFLLPETNGRSLPETIADLHRAREEERSLKLSIYKKGSRSPNYQLN